MARATCTVLTPWRLYLEGLTLVAFLVLFTFPFPKVYSTF